MEHGTPQRLDLGQPVGKAPMHVTAVVISFNTEDHIGACVHTLLNQTYPNLDIIVVDNNSG